MASPSPQASITIPLFIKDYLPVIISALMLLITLYSNHNARRVSKTNAELQAQLEDINNQRHWRREKIYSLADSLYELSIEYWLTNEDNIDNKKRALAMKSRIEDIEENASVLEIDISKPIQDLRHYATGDYFETAGRQALSTNDERFLYMRLHTQKIKASLG